MAKARKATKQLAFDLVDVYARRASAQGYALRPEHAGGSVEMEESVPLSGNARSACRHRRREGRHAQRHAHGPPGVRRRRLREDGGGAARRLQGHAGQASRLWCCARPPFWRSSIIPNVQGPLRALRRDRRGAFSRFRTPAAAECRRSKGFAEGKRAMCW